MEDVLKEVDTDFFDFMYSNHTFEHIEDLPAAIEQINRTCKRGFFALPASDFEFMTAKSHFGHVNLCRLINGVLHIAKRPPNTITNQFGYLFESKLFNDSTFRELWEGHSVRGLRFIWEARHYFDGVIAYKFYKGEEAYELFPQLRFFE